MCEWAKNFTLASLILILSAGSVQAGDEIVIYGRISSLKKKLNATQ